jgi:hypothetical protein
VDVKADSSGLLYYIHYHDCESSQNGTRLVLLPANVACNVTLHHLDISLVATGDKRLDEWVPASRVTTLLNAPSLGTELSSYNLLSTPSLAS